MVEPRGRKTMSNRTIIDMGKNSRAELIEWDPILPSGISDFEQELAWIRAKIFKVYAIRIDGHDPVDEIVAYD